MRRPALTAAIVASTAAAGLFLTGCTAQTSPAEAGAPEEISYPWAPGSAGAGGDASIDESVLSDADLSLLAANGYADADRSTRGAVLELIGTVESAKTEAVDMSAVNELMRRLAQEQRYAALQENIRKSNADPLKGVVTKP